MEILFCTVLFFFIIAFILYKGGKTEKELNKYMDDKISEYLKELKNK